MTKQKKQKKQKKRFYVGYCDGVLHVYREPYPEGTRRADLFLSREAARREYADVREVWISGTDA